MATVLIIDDNPAIGAALSLLLREPVDLVIQDMNFSTDTTSGDEGALLFRAIRRQAPDLPVILLTGWTRLESAVELVKAGAADYLAKPWDDTKLLATVDSDSSSRLSTVASSLASSQGLAR